MKTRPFIRWFMRFWVLVLKMHLVFIVCTSLSLVAYRWIEPPVTGIMVYRLFNYDWKLKKREHIALEKVPKKVRSMIIRVEDGSFYEHRGIILAAMKNAARVNRELGSPVYGGSTITMQTARTLFLAPVKSYIRKYLEVIIALEMEVILGKDRIFELYLNNAEWGKGVFGIEAASRHYYGKSVTKLTTNQSIRLVTLLSSPILYTPDTIQKSPILRSRYAYLVKRF